MNTTGSYDFRSLINDVARRYAYELYQVGEWTKAGLLLREILREEPEDAWSIALYGSILREQGRHREGLQLLQQAAALAPHDRNITTMRNELHNYVNQSH